MFLFFSYHRPYWCLTAYPKWPTFDFMAPSSLKGASLSASSLEKGSLWTQPCTGAGNESACILNFPVLCWDSSKYHFT